MRLAFGIVSMNLGSRLKVELGACLVVSAGLAVACGGAPTPASAPAASSVATPPPPAEVKPPPPEPLATQDLELTVQNGFLALRLESLSPKLWSDQELRQALPFAVRRELDALERARTRVRDARRKKDAANDKLFECDDCRQRALLERRLAAEQKRYEDALEAEAQAKLHAEEELQRRLDDPKGVAAIGIVLARLRPARDWALDPSVSVVYGEPAFHETSMAALQRAAELAGPDTEVGRHVRRELLHGLWARSDVPLARQVIAELEPVAPPEWRAELGFRAALLDGLEGNHRKAAERFEQALASHVPGSSVRRRTLANAVLLARYVDQDFEKALPAALRAFDEYWQPEPAPPAPKPKPKAKPKAQTPVAKRKAALRQAAEFGMLGLLSTTSQELDRHGAIRLAADCIERLGRDPASLQGSVEARAAVWSLLATRALYRNDLERARTLAEAARRLGSPKYSRGAVHVLEALALREGHLDDAKRLGEEARNVLGGFFTAFAGYDSEPDEAHLLQSLREPKHTNQDARKAPTREHPAAQNVRSLVRVCVEPVRTRLPKAMPYGKERHVAALSLDVRVFEAGAVEVKVSADRSEGSVPEVLACIQQLAPRLLARAPASIRAQIALSEPLRQATPSLLSLSGFDGGSLDGDAWGGLGGIGVIRKGKGGGGKGSGAGLGVGRPSPGAGRGSGGYARPDKSKNPSPEPKH